MTTRHAVIDSPLGELTLVANDDALTGVYFRQHWHPPAADVLGHHVEATADELFGRAKEQLDHSLVDLRV